MNSNREERLQMRQRGAASRKPKEVDFGFSFGLAPAIPEAPPQQPTTAPARQPKTQPAPQAQLSSPKTDLPGSQGSQRTPGSARNARPQRPSTFDIPSDDDEIELPRSAKRRKIETPTKIGRLGAKSRLPRSQPVESQRNGDTTVAAAGKSDGIPDSVPGQGERESANGALVSAPTDVPQMQPGANGGDKVQAAEAAPLQEAPEVQEPQEIQQPQPQKQPVQGTVPEAPQVQPVETPVAAPQEPPEPLQEQPQEPPQEQPQRTSPPQGTKEKRRKRDSQKQSGGVAEAAPETEPTQPPEEPATQDEVPPQRTISPDQGAKGKLKRRESAQKQAPADVAQVSTEKAEEPTPPEPNPDTQNAGAQRTSPRQAEGKRRRRESEEQAVTEASTKEPAQPSEPAEAQRPSPHQANTKRRRRVSQEKPLEDTTTSATKEVQEPESETQDAPSKTQKRRGRPPASARKPQEQPEEVAEAITEKTQPIQPTEPEPEPESATQDAASKPPKRRGRPPASAREAQEQPTEDAAEPSTSKAQPAEPEPDAQDTPPKKRRGRPPAAQPSDKPEKDLDRREPPEEKPREHTTVEAATKVQAPEPDVQDAAPKKRRGRPPASREPQEQPAEAVAEESQPIQSAESDPDTQDAAPKKRRGRPSAVQPSDKGKEPEREVSDEMAPEGQGRRGRKTSESKATEESSETIEEPQLDDTETRPTPKPGKRGRPAKRTVQVEQESEESQEPEEPEHAEPARPDDAQVTETERPTRKKRAPRGETVPVTVHRLANIPILGRAPVYDSSESESDSSADELTQRTKHPTRGGVNQADVLNQICRETLEKTLTTLQTGITNETNPQRKAEWTRKKKAVEAFGSELEGRLFEMSEMLDSNFVLGVQLRRAKREMMEMRSRLYHVRREREAIAVRTDSVRRRHAEEESGRMARTNINNSLHGLELAVERQRPDDEDEAPTSGLEYLVRAVGEEVSSRGDGGLLDRIKAFNAELERAARWLES